MVTTHKTSRAGVTMPDNHPSELNDLSETDALFQSIGDGAIVIDANGLVSRVNDVALRILGTTREDLMGSWYPDAVVAENENGEVVPRLERPIVEVFMTGKPISRKVYFRRGDGTRIPVALTVSPIIVNGKPVGSIEIFRDISQEVRLDRAKSEFIAVASHQLRTPATVVKQYLGLMMQGYAGEMTEVQNRYLHVANDSNDRQLRIIDDILKVAAAEAGDFVLKKEKTNLVRLARQVVDEQQPKFDESEQKVKLTYSQPLIYAWVDRDSFRMVLENLVDNAHKYTPTGKQISVDVTQDDTEIRVTVADEGVGIPKEELSKLFQKFSRLDNPLSVSSGGTGLGLYWVRQILTLHGFSVKVRSKLGKGTQFILLLPHNEQ